jgi:nucleotide-binding universal stress UspA family protein
MSARQIDWTQWAAFFDAFSRHYRGLPVDVQILGDNLGLYALAQGQPLIGITAQLNNPPHDIELIAGDSLAHVSHIIREPTEVWVDQGKSGRDSSLEISSKDGTTVLLQLGIAESQDMVLRLRDFPIRRSPSIVPRPLVLVAVDNSERALWAASAGGDLARRLGADVLLVHVINPAELFATREFVPADSYTAYKEAAQAAIDAARKLIPSTVHSSGTIEEGEAARKIAELAAVRAAEFIVIGSHGRGRVTQLLMGSTAAAVARLARCPVVVVSHMPGAAPPVERPSLGERVLDKLNPAEVPLE